MSYYHNLSIEELQQVIIDLDAQIEYGYQLMQNCGYTLAHDSAQQTQLMCKKILANKLSEQK